MEWRNGKADYTLRDPGALGALLIYDWRLRRLLTDREIQACVDRPLTTSVLRHLQRLGLVRALHGVRPQGGRMRLWTIEDVLKVQAVLDLRAATGAKLAECVDALTIHAETLSPLYEDAQRMCGEDDGPRRGVKQDADASALLSHAAALSLAVAASVHSFILRNRFDEVSAPAFLL